MILRTITISFIVALFCGCSALKINKKSTPTEPTQEQTIVEMPKPRILYPESNNHSTERVRPKGVTTKKEPTAKTPAKELQPQPINAYAMRFTEVESANVRVPGINPLPSNGLELSLAQVGEDFCYPYKGKLISNYGYRGRSMHTGVDLKAIPNDTIRAAMSGVVRMSKSYSGYGNIIVIRHYCGIETAYSHNSRNLVKVNDVVRAGDAIALAGRTGRATTEHLHFEVRVAGEHIDPNKLIDCDNMSLRSGSLNLALKSGKIIATHSSDLTAELTPNSIPATHLTPSTPVTKPQSHTTQQRAPSSDDAKYHRIVKGDTLSQIARNYSTTVVRLCELNKISKTHILQLGVRLRVK